jgi:hypothetical protein
VTQALASSVKNASAAVEPQASASVWTAVCFDVCRQAEVSSAGVKRC